MVSYSAFGYYSGIYVNTYTGFKYVHKNVYTVPYELMPPSKCSLFYRQEGNVYCGLKTCPKLTCSFPVSVPESCCPVCRGKCYSAHRTRGGKHSFPCHSPACAPALGSGHHKFPIYSQPKACWEAKPHVPAG